MGLSDSKPEPPQSNTPAQPPDTPATEIGKTPKLGKSGKKICCSCPETKAVSFGPRCPTHFPFPLYVQTSFAFRVIVEVPEDGKGMATSMLKCLIESDRCVCSPLFPCPIYPLWCPPWSNVWLWMINGGESPFLWEPVEMPLTHRRKAYHLCNSFSCFVPFRDGAQFCLCYLVGFVGAERCHIRSHNLCSRRPEVSYPSRHRTRGRRYLGVGSRWASCAHSLFIRPKLHFIWRGW